MPDTDLHLDQYYDASFDGAQFWEGVNGSGLWIEPDEKTVYSVKKIPGGDTSDVILDGKETVLFELPISAEASALSALRGKRDTSGTLIYHAGTVTALLVGVVNVGKSPHMDGYTATLQFLI